MSSATSGSDRDDCHPQAQRLGYLLKQAQQALREWMDQRLQHLGVTTPQYNVLASVQAFPGISNAALARGAFTTAQSMLGIVANLEKAGYLSRSDHPTHGRIRMSTLTEAGREVLLKAHELVLGVDEKMTGGFRDSEVDALCSLLLRCSHNLQDD